MSSTYPSAKHAEPSAPPSGAMAPAQAEASAPPMPEHVAQVRQNCTGMDSKRSVGPCEMLKTFVACLAAY